MAISFNDIDFGFRYGSKKAVDAADYLNGTFNIATDEKEIYVDIDGMRLSTKVIYEYETEYEIRAIENPVSGKLYYAGDTKNILAFDYNEMAWIRVGGKLSEIENDITELTGKVNSLNSFEIQIIEAGDSLPTTGESHIIYFVPQSNSASDNLYDEYLWIADPGYYEKIGVSRADFNNYYTKSQIDTTISDYYNKSQVNAIENTVYSAFGFSKSDVSSSEFINVESRLYDLENASGSASGDISNLTSRVTSLENTIEDLDFGEELES